MNRFLSLFAALFLLVCPTAMAQGGFIERENDSSVAAVDNQNAAMNAAIDKANGTILVFFDALDSGEYMRESFMLKVLTETVSEQFEHMWVIFIDMDEDMQIRGLLTHNPYAEGSEYAQGDVMTFTPDRISDWRYLENEKWRGDFTTRVIFNTMPAVERDMYLAEYHPDPLPETAKTE